MIHWQYNPYVLPLVIAAAVSAIIASFAWRRRPTPAAMPLVYLTLAACEWSLGYALGMASADLPAKVFWAKVQYFGIVSVPVMWLILALQYTNRERWLTRRNRVLLAIIPLLTLLLAWTNDGHGLIWSDIRLDTSGSFSVLYLAYGAFFWVWVIYSYALVLLGSVLLLQTLVRSPRLYRRQALALLIVALAPWVGNVLRISGLNPFPHLDLTNFAFTLSGLAAAWALFRFRLLDIIPVARDTLIENMNAGVLVLDAEDRIVDINPAACQLIGVYASCVGKDADTAMAAWPELVEICRTAAETQAEIRLGDTTPRYLNVHASHLYDQRKLITGRLIVLRDITERKRAEEALRENEELLRATLESTADGILVIGEGGKMIHANTRFAKMWRIPQPVLDSRDDDTLLDFVLDQLQDPEAFLTKVRYLYGSSKEDLDTLQFKDGRAFERFSRSLLQDGMVAGRVWSFRDITERKRAEDALRESEERHRLLFQNAPVGILSADATGHILAVNPAILKMLGSPSAEATRGINLLTFPLLVEVGFVADFRRCLEEEIAIVSERLYTSKWGKETYFKCHLTPIREADGQTTGLQAIIEDITERKRAEDALRRRAEELATLQATVLDITAPHDLPTLLQTIVERAAQLLDAPGGGLYLCDPDQKEVRCVVSYNTPHDYAGTVLKYGEGAAGAVAQTGEPLIIDDYRTWSGRAAVYEEEQPFTAVLTTPMIWQGQVTGMISVLHDVETRRFTQTDLELLTLFANHAAIAVENARLYEKALQDAKTKSFLLDEVNHRVKNTLTAIIGLLHVEQSYAAMADHATYEAIIQNLTNRVSGLATVHSLLSASEWAPLPLSDLAGQVIKSATQMCPRDKQVFIDTPPSPVRVTPDQAHNLALVINELATNTIQHTLPGRSTARISVRIALEDDGVLFEYRDDGPGYPEDVLRLERHAVGFDLIKNLTRQSLRGELSLHNDEGAVAVIRFPAQA